MLTKLRGLTQNDMERNARMDVAIVVIGCVFIAAIGVFLAGGIRALWRRCRTRNQYTFLEHDVPYPEIA